MHPKSALSAHSKRGEPEPDGLLVVLQAEVCGSRSLSLTALTFQVPTM